jgi:hypothetical protein
VSDCKVLLKIPFLLWFRLQRDLKYKGKGQHESGAFLLGKRNGTSGRKIISYICYDELDPEAYSTGICRMSGEGMAALWGLCNKHQYTVLADAHTHPTDYTAQSPSDKRNPMISRRSHLAMVIPCYAVKLRLGLKGIGIYEYQGDYQWRTVDPTDGKPGVILTLW